MMSAIATTLTADPQSRAPRGLDTSKGGDQTFGSVLADVTHDAGTESEPSSAPAPPPDAGPATVSPRLADLSAAPDATLAPSAARPTAGATAQGVQWLFGRFTAANAQAATGATVGVAMAALSASAVPDAGAGPTTRARPEEGTMSPRSVAAQTAVLVTTTVQPMLNATASARDASTAAVDPTSLGASDIIQATHPSAATQAGSAKPAPTVVAPAAAAKAAAQRTRGGLSGAAIPDPTGGPTAPDDIAVIAASAGSSATGVDSQESAMTPARASDETDTRLCSTDAPYPASSPLANLAAFFGLPAAPMPSTPQQAQAANPDAPAASSTHVLTVGTAVAVAADGTLQGTPRASLSAAATESAPQADPSPVKVTLIDATAQMAPSQPVLAAGADVAASALMGAAPSDPTRARGTGPSTEEVDLPSTARVPRIDAVDHPAQPSALPSVDLGPVSTETAASTATPGHPAAADASTPAGGGVAPSADPAQEKNGTPVATRPAPSPAPPSGAHKGDRAPSVATASERGETESPETATPAPAGVAPSPASGTKTTAPDDRPAPDAAQATPMPSGGEAAALAVRGFARTLARLASEVSETAASTAARSTTADATPKQPSALVPARSLTLQLGPADLGSVTVHLKLRDGALDVHLAADDQKTLGLLTHARETLSSAIGDSATPLNSLVIQDVETTSPQSAGSHDLTNTHRGSAADGQDAGTGGNGNRGTGGDGPTQRPPRGAPAHDASVDDRRGAGDLFV